jgi:hypothetical protein
MTVFLIHDGIGVQGTTMFICVYYVCHSWFQNSWKLFAELGSCITEEEIIIPQLTFNYYHKLQIHTEL